jgi:Rne/Rng family ribonuclease
VSAARRLFVSATPGEVWAALCEGDEVVELRLLRVGARVGVGDIVLGRIVALRPELPAALVDIGLDRPAFLSGQDTPPGTGYAGLTEGQAAIVQVAKEARADKAAGVTMRVRLAGRVLDLAPLRDGIDAARGVTSADRERIAALLRDTEEGGNGLVIRPAALAADGADVIADAAALRARWRSIKAAAQRAVPPARLEVPEPAVGVLIAEFLDGGLDGIVIDGRGAFVEARNWLQRRQPSLLDRLTLHAGPGALFDETEIAAAIETALARRVALLGGGALTIEITAAATMIDVDSGSDNAQLAVNLAAAAAVARQIRLRNLAGPIVIDFIATRRPAERDRILETLTRALATDPAAPQTLGWTRLGHIELMRKRRHPPLAELLFEQASGGGFIKTMLTIALDALRAAAREAEAGAGRPLILTVHPAVAATLAEGDAAAARRELETRLGRALTIVADPVRSRDTIDVRPEDKRAG